MKNIPQNELEKDLLEAAEAMVSIEKAKHFIAIPKEPTENQIQAIINKANSILINKTSDPTGLTMPYKFNKRDAKALAEAFIDAALKGE